jgi:hypothetical protein
MSARSVVFLLAAATVVACGRGSAPASETPASSAGPAASAPAPTGPRGTASLSGRISLEGPAPAAEDVKLAADPKCSSLHAGGHLERRLVDTRGGGLADALVYVKTGITGSYPPPADPVLIDQKGCDYSPRMLAKQVGQPLRIRNSDDTLHNIHPRPQVNAEWNLGQPRQGMESTRSFDKPEVLIPIGCDVHPWMRAWISVLPHPFFAVTRPDGSYEIRGLPAGQFEIEVLHPKLEPATRRVTLEDGGAARLDLSLGG